MTALIEGHLLAVRHWSADRVKSAGLLRRDLGQSEMSAENSSRSRRRENPQPRIKRTETKKDEIKKDEIKKGRNKNSPTRQGDFVMLMAIRESQES